MEKRQYWLKWKIIANCFQRVIINEKSRTVPMVYFAHRLVLGCSRALGYEHGYCVPVPETDYLKKLLPDKTRVFSGLYRVMHLKNSGNQVRVQVHNTHARTSVWYI